MRTLAIRQPVLGVGQEAWVPQTKKQPRGEENLPVVVRGDDGVHEGEETVRVVLDLDVDVKLDVKVLWLRK